MKLSIIIVNYNVKHFLEQCLHSVRHAIEGIDSEVFVVDNNSVDGSVEMLREKFQEVHLIANADNRGFSSANNQAIRISKGEYVLLLNPDTVVEKDTFSKCIQFMDSHPDAGGLGIKMVDGKGNFLPESKRGLPTPEVAFYKIFGLSTLFPGSSKFGKYHLSYLDKDKTHEVEILAGAYMLMRKSALDKVGLLDEAFFMYGEDIDLSYRLILGGYKNYYFPEARIIHYKGESTKKSSVNYVFVFYNAMIIFAKKHFSEKNARLFSFLINIAIYIRAGMAIINRFISQAWLPFTDAALIFGGMYFLINYWEKNVKFNEGLHYPIEFITIAVPLYIFTWLTSVYLSEGYDKPVRIYKLLKGILIGTAIILVLYALLNESFRFSRALILLGSTWAMISMVALRIVLHLSGSRDFDLAADRKKRIAIAGSPSEVIRVSSLLSQSNIHPVFTGQISVSEKHDETHHDHLGNISQLADIINIYKINEVIFCARDIPAQKIIDCMSLNVADDTEFKIAPPESLSIIGSNSIDTSGDLYVIDINSINRPVNLRNKRLLDLLISIVFIPLLPILIIGAKNKSGLILNILKVLLGKKSWVGYCVTENEGKNSKQSTLPKIKRGVLNSTDAFDNNNLESGTVQKLNMLYAKDYRIINDLNILFKGIKNLGRH